MVDYPRKKSDELAEAQAHLVYFQNQRPALEYAIKKMQEDLRLIEKNIKLWDGRLEKMTMRGDKKECHTDSQKE